jgi:hypothetical protein
VDGGAVVVCAGVDGAIVCAVVAAFVATGLAVDLGVLAIKLLAVATGVDDEDGELHAAVMPMTTASPQNAMKLVSTLRLAAHGSRLRGPPPGGL